jgi:hypothetical protein
VSEKVSRKKATNAEEKDNQRGKPGKGAPRSRTGTLRLEITGKPAISLVNSLKATPIEQRREAQDKDRNTRIKSELYCILPPSRRGGCRFTAVLSRRECDALVRCLGPGVKPAFSWGPAKPVFRYPITETC